VINVLLFLWGYTGPKGKNAHFYDFAPNDVMRLGAQIRANLSVPHRLVVVTDYPRDLFPGDIDYLPLGEHFGEMRRFGGCWLRLKCFAPEMVPVIGPRWVWIDLDSVVTGPLDPLIDRSEPLVLFKSDSIVGQRWNGSFVLGGSAGNEDIWQDFDPERSPDYIRSLREGRSGGPRGTDQAWLHVKRDASTAHVSATDGVFHWAVRRFRSLPENARLVTFPGSTKMTDPRVQRVSPWLAQYYPVNGGDPANGLPVVKPWAAVADVSGGRLRSIMKMRREARQKMKLERARA
jgi:hypothetical protein